MHGDALQYRYEVVEGPWEPQHPPCQHWCVFSQTLFLTACNGWRAQVQQVHRHPLQVSHPTHSTGAWASTTGVPSHALNRCMGIHHKYPPPRTQTLAHLTAYTTVVTYLALSSLLCRFMLLNVVISCSGISNSNGSCPKVVYVKEQHPNEPRITTVLWPTHGTDYRFWVNISPGLDDRPLLVGSSDVRLGNMDGDFYSRLHPMVQCF